jgi:hypothetical protein
MGAYFSQKQEQKTAHKQFVKQQTTTGIHVCAVIPEQVGMELLKESVRPQNHGWATHRFTNITFITVGSDFRRSREV